MLIFGKNLFIYIHNGYCSVVLFFFFAMLFNHSVMSDSLQHRRLQHSRLSCPSLSLGVCSNSCSLSQWCYPIISSSVIPFSSWSQSFSTSGSFPMSRLFTSGDLNIGTSASASVLPMNIQDWFPLGWIDWISLKSKGLSRVFSSTTVWKHQFFCAQPSLWSTSHTHETSLVAQIVKCLLTMLETWIQSLGQEDLLEKEMATHSSILA